MDCNACSRSCKVDAETKGSLEVGRLWWGGWSNGSGEAEKSGPWRLFEVGLVVSGGLIGGGSSEGSSSKSIMTLLWWCVRGGLVDRCCLRWCWRNV